MDDIINFLQNEPAVLVLLAVLTVTLALFLTLPAFYDRLKTIRLPTLPASAKKPSKEEKKEPRFKLQLGSKKVRLLVPIAIVVAIVAIGGGYLAYDFFFQPVRIVTANQFKLEKGGAIKQLQQEGLGAWDEVGVYLMDVRTSDEYAKEHIVASASRPAERAMGEYNIEDLAMVVYSTSSRFEEARKVAEAIKKNSGLGDNKRSKKIGTIYVIKDGFEGLKDAGLITESGEWD